MKNRAPVPIGLPLEFAAGPQYYAAAWHWRKNAYNPSIPAAYNWRSRTRNDPRNIPAGTRERSVGYLETIRRRFADTPPVQSPPSGERPRKNTSTLKNIWASSPFALAGVCILRPHIQI